MNIEEDCLSVGRPVEEEAGDKNAPLNLAFSFGTNVTLELYRFSSITMDPAYIILSPSGAFGCTGPTGMTGPSSSISQHWLPNAEVTGTAVPPVAAKLDRDTQI